MRNPRTVVAVILAAGLLATAGISGTVYAHGPGGGFPPRFPPGIGSSARPLPSGWAWPSDDLHSFVLKSFAPRPSQKPEPSKVPHPTQTCPPASGASPAPTAALTSAIDLLRNGKFPAGRASWDQLVSDWRGRFESEFTKQFCSVDPLRSVLDKQITGRIGSLQGLIGQVGGVAALSASDKTAIDNEINSLIADLHALKTKVDAETTLAALQADLATLTSSAKTYRSVWQWVHDIVGAEKAIAAGPVLVTLEGTVATQIAAAPPGPETVDAQTFLDNMKLAVTAGEALAGPLPATLLAITPAQLSSGADDATLAASSKTLFLATWDLQLARWSAAMAQRELVEASAPAPTAKPTPAATATPV
jgi:hypothetical protein